MSSSSDTLARARALAPLLRERSARIDAERKLGDDVADAIGEAGLFRMAVPRSASGPELAPRAILEAIEAVASVDAAAAWCVGIGATTGLVAAYLPLDAAREIFADPRARACGVFAPMGKGVREEGGYRVRGRWAFASGVDHSPWRMVGFFVDGENGPRAIQGMVRAEDTTIVDTWNVSGLRGTGSHDLAIEGAFVPDRFTLDLTATPRETGTLYRFPAFGLLALSISAVTLGIGRAAIDAFAALAKAKKQAGSQRTLAERETVQTELARAEGSLRAARALVMSTVDEVHARVEGGSEMSIADRASLRLAASRGAELAVSAVDVVQRLAGSASVYDAQPFGRLHRDAHIATQHLMISDTTYTMAGRALLGLPVQTAAL
ncbi:MAG: acyl-CoA dehydrogenase family protein [Sandaracinus sp.]